MGLSTEPCRTPELILLISDKKWATFTHRYRFSKQDLTILIEPEVRAKLLQQ